MIGLAAAIAFSPSMTAPKKLFVCLETGESIIGLPVVVVVVVERVMIYSVKKTNSENSSPKQPKTAAHLACPAHPSVCQWRPEK